MNLHFGKRAISVVAATSLAFSLSPVAAAWAEPLQTEGYVTGAATRAAGPAPEILGISSVEETANWTDGTSVEEMLVWSAPKFYLMGTTEYNTVPNPYYYNFLNNQGTAANQVVMNEARAGGGGGPMGALAAYGVDETDDAVWEMLPDVVIGVDSSDGAVDYDTNAAYGPAVSAALGVDYHPKSVAYASTDNSVIIDVMYDIAQAADDVVDESNGTKQLRYGDAMDIAVQYEEYVRGTQGYVLQQLAANGLQKKTVAAIGGYDAGTNTYTLLTSGVEEGTAATNRLLEAAEVVADNLVDTLGTQTVTADQLAQADLILVGGQSGVTPEDVVPTLPTELQEKCYYVAGNGSNGSMYGVTMNSVENAQNIGRVLGCLYPEYVDQDDWICYYYDNFYHIKADALASAVDNAMDGVRNWDATGSDLTSWTAADAATYNEAAVQAKLDAGMDYIVANESSLPAALAPTDEWAAANEDAGVSFPDVAEGEWYYDAVYEAAELGYMNGSDGLFRPDDFLTRAEAAAVVYNMAGGTAQADPGFSDVAASDWFYGPVSWAAAAGVVSGYSGTDLFGSGDQVTREQVAAMLRNWLASEGRDVSAQADLSRFSDGARTSDWAAESMSWAVAAGVFQGSDGALRPGDPITRAELAAVVTRL